MADKTYHASVGIIQDTSDDAAYDQDDWSADDNGKLRDDEEGSEEEYWSTDRLGDQSQREEGAEDSDWLMLPPFKRLEKICNDPDIYKRQQVGRTVPGALVSVADSSFDVARILLILNKVTNDPEVSVRLELAEALPHICLTCHSRDHASQLRPLVLSHLLPLNLRMLSDRDIKVRKAAQKSLIVILENDILDPSSIENVVCTHVVSLADQEDEMYHMTAVELMSTMAPLLGPELTESAFIPKFLQLCASPRINVRHTCAQHFGDFCAVVLQPIIEKSLLPSFVRLTLDPLWNVRKACAQVIMSVSCACALDARKNLLAPIFARFLSDENRWVRVAAFQTLGPFITTFAQPSITGLAYNNSGELVLVNPDGFEFKCPISNESMNSIMNCMELGLGLSLGNNNLNSSNSNNKPGPVDDDDDDDDNVIDYNVTNSSTPETRTPLELDENYNYFQYWREPIANINEDDSESNLLKLSSSFDNLCSLVDSGPPPDRATPALSTPPSPAAHEKTEPNKICEEDRANHNHMRDEQEAWRYENSDEESEDNSSTQCSYDSQDMTPQIPSSNTSPFQHIVPQELIDYYVKMFHCGSDPSENSDLARHCAFSLPAVALTLGSPNWSLLRPVTKRLACDEHWKVRRMVAACMHELAVIVGPGAATRDLLPVYTELIKDLDEVRIGALRILSRFLFLLKPEGRQRFLPMFNKFLATDYEWNWRFRAEFVEQLGLSLGFFSPAQIWEYLAPLALLLLSDKVATVRRVAVDLVNELLVHLSPSSQLTRSLTTTLAEDFAHSPSWTQRQTFASLCARLVTPPHCAFGEGRITGSSFREGKMANNYFEERRHSAVYDDATLAERDKGAEMNCLPYEMFACDLLPHLMDLARDPVPNVRLCVARTLALHIAPLPFFQSPCPHSEVLMNTLLTLMSDADSDVRYFATIKPEQPHDLNQTYATSDTEVNESQGNSSTSSSSDTSSPSCSKMMKTGDHHQSSSDDHSSSADEIPKTIGDNNSYESIPHIDDVEPSETEAETPEFESSSKATASEVSSSTNPAETPRQSPSRSSPSHQDSPRPRNPHQQQSNSRKRHRN